MKKNSGRNKEKESSVIKFEKCLQDWKLPPLFSASDIFEKKSSFCLFPDFTVKTVEKEIPLTQGRSTFPLFSKNRRKAHQIFHGYVQVGAVTVGVKPSKLGSNASAVICIRDKRLSKYNTVLAMGESSLCDGPIFFSYFPTYCVALPDSSVAFGIDVRVKGNERVSLNLMYKFHYKVRKMATAVKWEDNHDGVRIIDVERGKTTLYLDKGEGEGGSNSNSNSNSNRLVSKTINWYQIAIREGLMMPANDVSLPTYGSDSEVGDTKKETAEAHVLKLDVPGFKREEVKVLRRFRLPENAKLEEEEMTMTVTILKEEVKKPQVKLIHISA